MQAAQKAIASPLLEDSSVNGARGVIINITGGPDLSLLEVNEASCVIQEAAHEDANIIFGAVVDPSLTGKVKITVIATGFDRETGRPRDVADGLDAGGPVELHGTPARARGRSGSGCRCAGPCGQRRGRGRGSLRCTATSGEPPYGTRLVAAGGGQGGPPPRSESADFESPLDVPAFLRRQS